MAAILSRPQCVNNNDYAEFSTTRVDDQQFQAEADMAASL